MKITICTVFYLLIFTLASGQRSITRWYSATTTSGVTIQNSYPKGGPYHGPTKKGFHYSHLVFFTRVINESEHPLELKINFSGDSIAIPNSPGTFMKLFIPQDTMTIEKINSFGYGITELESLDRPTKIYRKIDPNEDALFYVVAIFYQTKATEWIQERGGNRAELILEGQDLIYRMLPQVDTLPCGNILFHE